MPTENEAKFVLGLDCEEIVKKASKKWLFLSQAYLEHSHVRVRSIHTKNKKPVFQLCYKHHTPSRLIEIETDIDNRDFSELWQAANGKMKKTRYEIGAGNNLWVVDFFKTEKGKTYFVQAEHEMPEAQLKPKKIPDIIRQNLVYEVPRSDGRFTSRKLWNVEYAKKLYQVVQRKRS